MSVIYYKQPAQNSTLRLNHVPGIDRSTRMTCCYRLSILLAPASYAGIHYLKRQPHLTARDISRKYAAKWRKMSLFSSGGGAALSAGVGLSALAAARDGG